ncbi:uncharacterized protein VTP21DRAFT_7123 [Calcarisporiella thermophila]|uniref:uncharacterized protein n=1 Tax=Calcarisporiella thermophila TaxID=911321 RepID=UPI0037438FCA
MVSRVSLPLQRLSSLSTKEDLSDLNIPTITEGAEDVAGLRGRIRLQKDNSRNWMERQRKYLQAYEYLCHIGEAKEWIEDCLNEEIAPIVELEEALRNGIILAKLARWFAPGCVRRIFKSSKLQFRHSDNINAFLEAIRKVELPSYFWFELTDLYEKKNIPRVIYCIHALSYLLSRRGLAPCVNNLVGQLEFTEEEIHATQQGLLVQGIVMPRFDNIGSALSRELREYSAEIMPAIGYDACEDTDSEEYETPEPNTPEPELSKEEELAVYWSKHERQVVHCQAHVRRWLERQSFLNRRTLHRQLEPFIIALQAHSRGVLARRDFERKLRGLLASEPVIINLQSRVRGLIARKKFAQQRDYFEANVAKIVKIQSLFRAKLAENAYRQLTTGSNPPVSTIKSFVHLLNDNNLDFEEELAIETCREKVVRLIRENRSLDSHLNELDLKIGMLVKNRATIDEVYKLSKKQCRRMSQAIAISKSAQDSFSFKGMDKESRRRLELYQQLFYLLQTQPQYLSRLLFVLNQSDRVKKTVETTMLTLFGYAQNTREEYLLLKLLQSCIREELKSIENIQEFMRGNFMFLKLVLHYYRGPKERKYLRELFSPLINRVLDDEMLDLQTNPLEIYKACINNEESRTGRPTSRPLNLTSEEALLNDAETKTIFIQHLQQLRTVTEDFLNAILNSLDKMPYGIRIIARELKDALTENFPNEPESEVMKVIGNFVYYRYINPAIVAPEMFDVVERRIDPQQRKNLGQIAKMLHQIARGKIFADGEGEDKFVAPLNSYVIFSSGKFSKWFQAVTQAKTAEAYFHIDQYIDHATTQKPILYISPAEIFSMHGMLVDNLQEIAPLPDDPLNIILKELGKVPVVDETVQQQSDISLTLTDRFSSEVQDPDTELKRLFVETKSQVLMVIRVQKGRNLLEILISPVTPEDETAYAELIRQERGQHRANSASPLPESFAMLKRQTIENVLRLEAEGRVHRENNYQEMLNSIAIDIRNKHRRCMQRRRELQVLKQTLANLEEKRRYLDDQKQSYYSYIDTCMENMKNSRGRRSRLVLPFTRQYFHLRELQRQGRVPRFGSYKYSAAKLHARGVLLEIEGVSPRQFERIMLTISSDEIGVFRVEAAFAGLGITGGVVELRLEDMLQCQFNNVQTVTMFDGAAKVNVNLLLFLINRKFFV